MQQELKVYNSLSRQKEKFEPINAPFVGMYVCGPTVYSNVHLGNVRTFMSFDVIYRYLTFIGYKVRYVRNITDAGHLENDADVGEDKISKKAKLEKLEPMEIVQRYTVDFRTVMGQFNNLPPSIEPTATGHIVEQIEMTKQIIANGMAYESNGTVYFDVEKFSKSYPYTQLSGRNLEELLNNTRELDGQVDKKGRLDFALWIKAKPEHIMRWPSPWGEGFPGWHIECSAMSSKYLGEEFDIHGGGMDLVPTHHTNEIAQNVACHHKAPARYWLHTNMLTVNGQKMSKSLGNSFLPDELFKGSHPLLDKGYSPMTVRFFMLQAHYRSTLDFSNEALQAAKKGFTRIANGLRVIKNNQYEAQEGVAVNAEQVAQVNAAVNDFYAAMNDDFNTAVAISHLFNLLKKINLLNTQQLKSAELGEDGFDLLKTKYIEFTEQVLGLKEENSLNLDELIQSLLTIYKQAKADRDYARVDFIRAELKKTGVVVKDMKTGIEWAYEE